MVTEEKYLDILSILQEANPKFRGWAIEKMGEYRADAWQQETIRLLQDFLFQRIEVLDKQHIPSKI